MLTFYELDLGLNHVVRKYNEPMEDQANLLIAGMCLLCSVYTIYKEYCVCALVMCVHAPVCSVCLHAYVHVCVCVCARAHTHMCAYMQLYKSCMMQV